MISQGNQSRFRPTPPLGLAVAASALAVAAFAFIRLYVYGDRLVSLTYALPLLLGVWHKNRPLHLVLTAMMATIAAIQVFVTMQGEPALVPHGMNFAMMLANIGIVGVVVDRLIVAQKQLGASYLQLEQANYELAETNEELAARDEEISSQNESLQAQAEELEHQMEELQQQSEELQQQSEELQNLNEESASRQRVLEALLEASTMPASRGGVPSAAARICDAALQVIGHDASGALIVVREEGSMLILGHCGVKLPAAQGDQGTPHEDPFALAVIVEGRTAAIEDLAATPEVAPPRSQRGDAFRAALAAPIKENDQSIGALVLYSLAPREWTHAEFKIAEWLAAQAGLVLLSARLQLEIERRREEAEDASQRKTRFLAAVSHDVRTPANAISLTAEVIKQAGDNPDWAHEIPELAEALRSNAKLLVELVSDVLDLARFDSGKVDVETSEFNLQDMVAKEIMQYQALASTAGLRLTGTTDAEPIWLRTDRMKLARVLSNLIGNAIKFTDVGGVDVRCTRSSDGMVEVHVADTGVGIQQDHLEHIFDEFFQIKNPERDRSKGTGLGLAICKRLVDAIGCSLSVRSRFGAGTTFAIRIPQELVVEPPPVAKFRPSRPPAAQRLAGLRVLLVEDHEATRSAFTRLLGLHGATVDAAVDGREALRVLTQHAPDVVLLDLMLPDMDGREVLRHLAAQRSANLRCLLAVSGDVTEGRRSEVESLGADGLVAKPLQIEPLVDRICEVLQTTPARPTQQA